jgi:hypothetical protein
MLHQEEVDDVEGHDAGVQGVRRGQPEFLQEEAQQRERVNNCPSNNEALWPHMRRYGRLLSAVRCLLADLGAAGELAGLLVHSHAHAAVFVPELCGPRCTHQILHPRSQLFGVPNVQFAHPLHTHICQVVPSLRCQQTWRKPARM